MVNRGCKLWLLAQYSGLVYCGYWFLAVIRDNIFLLCWKFWNFDLNSSSIPCRTGDEMGKLKQRKNPRENPTSENELVQQLLSGVPEYIQKVLDDTQKTTQPFRCAVVNCTNTFESFEKHQTSPYKFHNFPVDNKKLLTKWILACGTTSDDVDVTRQKVCSDHFELNDYIRNYKEEIFNPNFKRKLSDGAVPHIGVPKSSSNIPDIKIVTWDSKTNKVPSSASANDIYTYQKDQKLAASIAGIVERVEAELEEENSSDIVPSRLDQKFKGLKRKRECETEVEVEEYGKSDDIDNLFRKKEKLENNIKQFEQYLESLEKSANSKKQVITKYRQSGLKKSVFNLVKEGIFTRAQLMFLLGRKKVIWSDDDYASAFNLRHLAGKEAYLYMKNELKWPLPSLSSVQIWAASD